MLKKDLAVQLDAANSLIKEYRFEAEKSDKRQIALCEQVSNMEPYKKSVEQARVAIDSLIAVNCTVRQSWEIDKHHFYDMHHNEGKDIPAKPSDPLFDALTHLRHMLVEREKTTGAHDKFLRY